MPPRKRQPPSSSGSKPATGSSTTKALAKDAPAGTAPAQLPFGAKSLSDLTPAQKLAYGASRLFRVALLLFALWTFWPRLIGKQPWLQPAADSPSTPPNKASRSVFGRHTAITLDAEKRARILDAFVWSYDAYSEDAFGKDDYHPISHAGSNMSPAGPLG